MFACKSAYADAQDLSLSQTNHYDLRISLEAGSKSNTAKWLIFCLLGLKSISFTISKHW